MSEQTTMIHVEHSDVTEYMSQITKQAKEAIGIYEMIAHQNVEKGLSLLDISIGLVEELSKSGVEVFATDKVTDGLITIKLPLTSPLIRTQRALTIASIMSGEAIPPQLAIIDEVVAVAVTTLLNAQNALKTLRAEQNKAVDSIGGGVSKVAEAVAKH
jgi:hypothetical protein